MREIPSSKFCRLSRQTKGKGSREVGGQLSAPLYTARDNCPGARENKFSLKKLAPPLTGGGMALSWDTSHLGIGSTFKKLNLTNPLGKLAGIKNKQNVAEIWGWGFCLNQQPLQTKP